MSKKPAKQPQQPLQSYFLPDYGISVEAESIDAAIEKAEKVSNKQEDGDGE